MISREFSLIGIQELVLDARGDEPTIPDNSALFTDSPVDGLPDPPMCICRELEASRVVKPIHALDEASDAFSNQVRQIQPPSQVLPSYGHDKPLVAVDHLPFSCMIRLHSVVEGLQAGRANLRSPLFIRWRLPHLLCQILSDCVAMEKILDMSG